VSQKPFLAEDRVINNVDYGFRENIIRQFKKLQVVNKAGMWVEYNTVAGLATKGFQF
jgi:hypothetical protein